MTQANLGNAEAVAATVNAAFDFTDAGIGQDLLLVVNDTDSASNKFSVWQWLENMGNGE